MQIDALQMLREIVSCFGVNFTVIRRDMEEIPEFDLGLRRTLGQTYDLDLLLTWCEQNVRPGCLIFVQDFTCSEYAYLAFPGKERGYGDYLAIGPYLGSMPSEEEIRQMIEREQIPEQFAAHLMEYLHAVPVIADTDSWREVIKRFMVTLYQTQINVEYLTQQVLETVNESEPVHEFLSADLIEKRYKEEEGFCRLVVEGKTEEALTALTNLTRFRIQSRYREPISQIRSQLIMMNTMLRREMIKAEIHPYHIDRLSSQLGRKIELVFTDKDASNLRNEMVRKYCMLVNNYSLKGYSEVIRKVVNYVRLNLTADLSLKNFAAMYSINASYLSSLFKKEMGMTITDYVNHQRIRYSISLLNATDKQIQDIAAECGIYDVNYYRRLFKRIVGLSPSEYIRQIHKKG